MFANVFLSTYIQINSNKQLKTLAGVPLTAPPPIRRITPLQRWLDDHDMTPTSLAVELAIPKETTLALASGSTERISLKYLQAIQNYTSLFLRLVCGTGDLADDELPQIRRWWWRIPTEFPQPPLKGG